VAESGVPAGPAVVLVVDDARFFREMIKDILKELPIELEEAADGDAAWQRITAADPPRLVLLDLNIPGRSGKEIIAELGKLRNAPEIRVLAMSGVERGEETALELRRIGADDFINKSFKPAELRDRVRKILGL
jgi:DNA-binding response OmpR family regulator